MRQNLPPRRVQLQRQLEGKRRAVLVLEAARALKERGAARVIAYCTHPVLSGKAVERIANSALDEIVVTDTIPLSAEAAQCPRIRVISIAGLLAETMLRISNEDSVSSLFVE